MSSDLPFPGTAGEWQGFPCYDFTCNGRASRLVSPHAPLAARHWAWRLTFFGAWPETDLELLRRGFFLAYTDLVDLYGAPVAVAHGDAFYRWLTDTLQLHPQVALIALSRGGLIAFNWAAAYPERVSCIYADAPVCDFRSWPGGQGKAARHPAEWQKCLDAYGFTEEQALRYGGNPIDNLEPLARRRVPLLHVCGDSDETVPIEENTLIVQARYQALGGPITVITKPGVGHHPHSLDDVTPIVDFIWRSSGLPPTRR